MAHLDRSLSLFRFPLFRCFPNFYRPSSSFDIYRIHQRPLGKMDEEVKYLWQKEHRSPDHSVYQADTGRGWMIPVLDMCTAARLHADSDRDISTMTKRPLATHRSISPCSPSVLHRHFWGRYRPRWKTLVYNIHVNSLQNLRVFWRTDRVNTQCKFGKSNPELPDPPRSGVLGIRISRVGRIFNHF